MVFTAAEVDYLDGQALGRLATIGPDGAPQVRPVGFTCNSEESCIDIGGANLSRSRKYRNLAEHPQVAFVVDDLASRRPWRPRGVEVRGRAEALPATDGHVELIRIRPERILSWGLESDPFAAPLSRRIT